MEIAHYQQGDKELLQRLAGHLPAYHPLRYPEFVDYYYATSPHCHLHLHIGDRDQLLAVLGLERMPFATTDGNATVGFGSNFFALARGAGAILFLHWMKNCDLGLVYGGSPATQAILRQQRWSWYPDAREYQLNRAFGDVPGETWWRRMAKTVLEQLPPRRSVSGCAQRLLAGAEKKIEVNETDQATEKIIPQSSPFPLRFAPDAAYLNWRYNTQLRFVRYRLFQIVSDQIVRGYVVLNVQRRRVIVAQCDATDTMTLVRGVMAALSSVHREMNHHLGVLWASTHRETQRLLAELGFRARARCRQLAMGGLRRRPPQAETAADWLINADWGDNGLRPPFLGIPAIST